MMWIDRIEKEPDPEQYEYILVIGSECGKPHVAYFDYEDWNHTECCQGGSHFPGVPIKFERWMPFNQPERSKREDLCKLLNDLKEQYSSEMRNNSINDFLTWIAKDAVL